jgi:hypothetical protein
MNYFVTLSVPPLTDKDNPVKYTLPVHIGTITDILVIFPLRCCSLVHVTVRDKNWQIVPYNQDSNVVGNGINIDFPMNYDIKQPPLQLYFTGWSEDDTYTHTPKFKITIDESSSKSLVNTLLGL